MRCVLKMLGICLVAIFMGTVALIAVYNIPTDTIYRHLQRDKEIFQKEGNDWSWAQKAPTKLDVFTDSIMLMNAAYPVDSAPTSAMAVFKWQTNELPAQTLVKALNDKNDETLGKSSYYRYWHGYLVYLKPILFISSYHDFRMLNASLLFLLTMAVLILFYLRLGVLHTVAFAITILFINPVTVAMSLQNSSIFYIMLISVLFILWKNDTIQKNNLYVYFFLTIGILTSYIDFLTYPVVGIGVPLLVYILLNRELFINEKAVCLSVIKNSCAWGFGYLTMWAGKCLAAFVVLQHSILPEVLDALKKRSSGDINWEFAGHAPVDFTTVLQANFKAATAGPWIYIFSVFLIYLIYRMIKNRPYGIVSPGGGECF